MKKFLKRALPIVLVVAMILSLSAAVFAEKAKKTKTQADALIKAATILMSGELEEKSNEDLVKAAAALVGSVGKALLTEDKMLPTYIKLDKIADDTIKSVKVLEKTTLTEFTPALISCIPNTYKVTGDNKILLYNYSLKDCTVFVNYEKAGLQTYKMTLPEIALDMSTLNVVFQALGAEVGEYSMFATNGKTNALIDTAIQLAPIVALGAVGIAAQLISEKQSTNSVMDLLGGGKLDVDSLVGLLIK